MKQELIDRAIKKLQLAAKMSEQYDVKPLIIAYSGGKGSDVLLALARMSGIKYELINSHTTVDAPETVYHIREVFAVERARGGMATILYPTYKGGADEYVEADCATVGSTNKNSEVLLCSS